MLMMKVANVERLAVEMMTIYFMPTPAESKEQREKRENHDACVADVRQEHGKLRRYMMLTKCLWELTCQMIEIVSTIFVKVLGK